jgi:hypothetical protein
VVSNTSLDSLQPGLTMNEQPLAARSLSLEPEATLGKIRRSCYLEFT